MDDRGLEIQRLQGEIQLLKNEIALLRPKEDAGTIVPGQVDWWAEEMLFWRTKYLREHPERANKEYILNARADERLDVILFV